MYLHARATGWPWILIPYDSWKRNDLVVSTKIYWGGAFGENPVNNGGLSRKHLVEGLNASLERLQLDYGTWKADI